MLKFEDVKHRRAKRLTEPFSLYDSLISQGCSHAGARAHMNFVYMTQQSNPTLDVERYTVPADNPDSLPYMG